MVAPIVRTLDRGKQRLAALPPIAILLIGWGLFLVYAYPGLLSFDSIYQLREARKGVYSNWHPPAMAALWRLVECVVAGPVGMLLLQSTAFLAGAYLLFRRHLSARAAALMASLLLLFPPVGTTMAVIWKDSQMLGYLLLGTAWLLSERRRVRFAGLAMLTVASMMRHNGFTITLPIVILMFEWAPRLGFWRRYAIAAAAWLGITAVSFGVNAQLTTVEWHFWSRYIATVDIIGTLRYAPPMSDDELRAVFGAAPVIPKTDLHAKARESYGPENFMYSVLEGPTRYFDWQYTDEQLAGVSHAWRTLIFEHPGAYLHYRWDMFLHVLHLTSGENAASAYVWFTSAGDLAGSAAEMQHNHSASAIQRYLLDHAEWLGRTWLFRPYIYLFILLALVPLWIRDRELFAYGASAIISEAALALLAVTPDFRYSLWMVITTLIVIVILIAKRSTRMRLEPVALVASPA
jgi:hypothetical protein